MKLEYFFPVFKEDNIKDYLANYSLLTKRLSLAFPNIRMRIEKYRKLLKK